MRPLLVGLVLLFAAGLAVGCAQQPTRQLSATGQEQNSSNTAGPGAPEAIMALQITSPAFQNNSMIPRKYTCQGQDINPPLQIGGVPAGAKSLALLMDDPDAPMGTWDHWVMWNIPLSTDIGENSVPPGAVVGRNSWPKNSYGGPCPPSGTHRYFFKLYALDSTLDLPQSATKRDVEAAMKGHIIEQAQLIGLYKKG